MPQYVVAGKKGALFNAKEHYSYLQAYGNCQLLEHLNIIIIEASPTVAQELINQGYLLRESSPLRAHAQVQEAATGTPISAIVDKFVARPFHSVGWTGKGWTIAVLDTGVRKSHVALRGRVIYEESVVPGLPPDDAFGHGTFVASLAAGNAPQYGIVGIAPDANIVSIKVLNNEGEGSDTTVLAGINRLLDLHKSGKLVVPLVNMSFGRPATPPPDILEQAVLEMIRWGMVVTVAAGNKGPDPSTVTSPATQKYAVAVGSVSLDYVVSNFSGRGPHPFMPSLIKPDICAYGENIIGAGAASDTALLRVTGTSVATPQITGGLAILGQSLFGTPQRVYEERGPRPWTDEQLASFHQQFESYVASTIAGKPDFAPVPAGVKDNAYGWGIPLLTRAYQESISKVTLGSMMPLVMMVGLISMVGKMRARP